METNEFFISRDVIFFEDKFPWIESTSYVLPPILQNNKLIMTDCYQWCAIKGDQWGTDTVKQSTASLLMRVYNRHQYLILPLHQTL